MFLNKQTNKNIELLLSFTIYFSQHYRCNMSFADSYVEVTLDYTKIANTQKVHKIYIYISTYTFVYFKTVI